MKSSRYNLLVEGFFFFQMAEKTFRIEKGKKRLNKRVWLICYGLGDLILELLKQSEILSKNRVFYIKNIKIFVIFAL